MAVYLASDVPLPLISWDESTPGFNVVELQRTEIAVTKQFSKPYIYYMGAHTGCSCGFTGEPDEAPDLPMDSRKAFQAYIKEALEKSSLELFVCWEGDWEKEPRQKLKLKADDFIEADKWHHELTYGEISKKDT